MASNDEGQGSGDCDDVYWAADEFFSFAVTQTSAETETDAEIQTGIETGAETGAASGSGAGVEPKAKRQRLPNKLGTTRVVVTEVDNGNLNQRRPRSALVLRQSNRLHHTDNRHHQR